MRGRELACLFAVALAAAACDDDVFEIGDLEQEFVLTTVEQDPVPAVVATASVDGRSCTLEVVEGRLLLRPDGRFELNTQGRERCVSGGSSDSSDDSNTVTGRFEVDGATLRLSPDAGSAFQIRDHTFQLGTASITAASASIEAARAEQPFAASLRLVFVRRD